MGWPRAPPRGCSCIQKLGWAAHPRGSPEGRKVMLASAGSEVHLLAGVSAVMAVPCSLSYHRTVAEF